MPVDENYYVRQCDIKLSQIIQEKEVCNSGLTIGFEDWIVVKCSWELISATC
jgi:hypothetical protein